MAKRYSGNLQISVVYDDKNFYRTSVSSGGKHLWSGIVRPAPAGFGPGIAYDSPRAYDAIAQTAIAFAEDEIGGIADDAEFDEDLTGYLVRRSPLAKTASHAKRRATIQIGDCVVMREPHRRYITSSTGAVVFKVVDASDGTLTIEGPLDHHPKHRQRKVMGAQQFKRVACPRFSDNRDGPLPVDHATKRPRIVVRKIGERWQPVDDRGEIVRGSIYNADGTGYSTRQGAAEAAAMLRQLNGRG